MQVFKRMLFSHSKRSLNEINSPLDKIKPLNIISWSVGGFSKLKRMFRLGLFLNIEKPYLLSLQDIRIGEESNTKSILDKKYPKYNQKYSITKKNQLTPNGVMVYSRKNNRMLMNKIELPILPGFDPTSRVMVIEHENFVLINAHFPSPMGSKKKLKYLQRMQNYVLSLIQRLKKSNEHVILTMDYPYSLIQSAITKKKIEDEELEKGIRETTVKFINEIKSLDLVDSFEYFYGKTIRKTHLMITNDVLNNLKNKYGKVFGLTNSKKKNLRLRFKDCIISKFTKDTYDSFLEINKDIVDLINENNDNQLSEKEEGQEETQENEIQENKENLNFSTEDQDINSKQITEDIIENDDDVDVDDDDESDFDSDDDDIDSYVSSRIHDKINNQNVHFHEQTLDFSIKRICQFNVKELLLYKKTLSDCYIFSTKDFTENNVMDVGIMEESDSPTSFPILLVTNIDTTKPPFPFLPELLSPPEQ